MKNLTADKCREWIDIFTELEKDDAISIAGEAHLQAYRIALPILEQQERGDGWIEWGGGDCPVERMAIVEVKFTQTPQGEGIAHWWDWHHEEGENNIIAYRIIPEQPTNQNGEQ
ncbi:hypothetical protein [Pantoea brenneri]|uniref:hypothetical protein n=1 Tax=Pantoea brenneri TaxID=472694 RepID=UPI00289E6594|nr:hypothetical protein [Pantoea brenneri]